MKRNSPGCQCCEGECCCTPWAWDWSVVLAAVSGNAQCPGLDGTYNFSAASFEFTDGDGSIDPCDWRSVFDTGLDWDDGTDLYDVFVELRLRSLIFEGNCIAFVFFTIYAGVAVSPNPLTIAFGLTLSPCAEPTSQSMSISDADGCDASSTATVTAT